MMFGTNDLRPNYCTMIYKTLYGIVISDNQGEVLLEQGHPGHHPAILVGGSASSRQRPRPLPGGGAGAWGNGLQGRRVQAAPHPPDHAGAWKMLTTDVARVR